MRQVLRLDWPVCRDGYELVSFDSRKVNWPLFLKTKEAQQQQLTEQEQRFLEIWGERLSLYEPDFEDELWFLPRSTRFNSPDVMAKDSRLFSRLADARESETKIRRFVDQYGLLWTNMPCSLSCVKNLAKSIHRLVELQASKDRRGKFEWLNLAKRYFDKGLGSDLQFRPEVNSGAIEFVLRPVDLELALILQLIFSGTQQLKIHQCANCGNLIQKGPKLYRQDRKHCSNACRQQAYRNKAAKT
jgi:hypothetical protein